MEENKDLTKLQFDELVGSLMSHEERLKETFEAVEKDFSSKLQITKNEDASSSTTKSHQGQGEWQNQNYSRGRGRGGSSGRGSFKGRGRGRFDKRNVQCYHCNRYGHFERECRLKEGKNANYAQESGEYPPDHLFLSYAKGENTSKDVWYLDSGCSNHMTGNEKLFSAKDGSFKSKIQLGDDKSLEVAAKGAMEVQTKEGIKSIHDIYYTPQLKHNLLSVGQLCEKNYKVVFENKTCTIYDKNKGNRVITIVPMKRNRMFPLRFDEHNNNLANMAYEDSSWLWHLRYGHLNFQSLKFLISHALVSGLPKVEEHKEAKSEALDTFKKFKALVENERGCKIKCLWTDRGGEFCSKDFESYCDMNGIKRQHTTTYTPQQNGIAERKNHTMVEMARCMLQTKGLSNSYWGDAVATTVYILNHSPTSALENMTPYEATYGEKPNVNHFKVFGCLTYVHVPDQNRKKLDAKSEL
eukprot:PITA_28318